MENVFYTFGLIVAVIYYLAIGGWCVNEVVTGIAQKDKYSLIGGSIVSVLFLAASLYLVPLMITIAQKLVGC